MKTIEFEFQHIVLLSNRDISRLLEEIDNFTLICACQNCDQYLLELITTQFCQRGRDYFFDDLYKHKDLQDRQILKARERIGKMLAYLHSNNKLKDWKNNLVKVKHRNSRGL